jgi:dTDP-4-dehydrorhamnose reductase
VTFLLVGGDSEIAVATLAHLRRQGTPAVTTTRRRGHQSERIFLDLAAPLARWEPPTGVDAACIFAAVGHLVDCHRDPVGSRLINVTGTIELVERLVARGIYVLFLSTNQVFDGTRAHVPAGAPLCPVSEYGRQKADTEIRLQAMLAAGSAVGILRLAKIVSPGVPLLRQWQAALAAGQSIRPFHDMVMAPTPVSLAAAAIAALLADRAAGIWQLTGSQDVSYAEIAGYIAQQIGADPALVQPVAAASAGMPEGSTPRHTTLDSGALQRCFAIAAAEPWPTIEAVLGAPEAARSIG